MQKIIIAFVSFVAAAWLVACQSTPPAAPTVGISLGTTPTPRSVETVEPTLMPSLVPTQVVEATAQATAVASGNTADVVDTGENAIIGNVRYRVDADTLSIQLEARRTWADLGDGVVEVYIGTPRAPATVSTTLAGTALGFDGGYLGQVFFDSTGVAGAELKDVSDDNWSNEGTVFEATQRGNAIDLAIPLELLGNVQSGSILQLRVVASRSERELQLLPAAGRVQISVP